MRLSLSEENILREYQATTQAQQQHNLNQEQLQSLKTSVCLPFAKHLQAESLSTLSQGNSTISQLNNAQKPASSERRQLRYGGGQRGDSSQVKCVFELYHDDDEDNTNSNSNNNNTKIVQSHPELDCTGLAMSSNLDASVRIGENNRRFSCASANIRPSPNSAFSSSRNNNNASNHLQGPSKQIIDQCDQPSKFLYNTILSGISNGTGPISHNFLEQQDTEQFSQLAGRNTENTSKLILHNQHPNYSDILDASAYSIYLQHNKTNKSIEKQPKGFFTSSNHSSIGFSESSQIVHNSKNQISRQAGISWDSRNNNNINDYWNSNYNSAADALTQASLQSRSSNRQCQKNTNKGIISDIIVNNTNNNPSKISSINHRRSFETSGLSQSLQDRVLVINQEDQIVDRAEKLSNIEFIQDNAKLTKLASNNGELVLNQRSNQLPREDKSQKRIVQCYQQVELVEHEDATENSRNTADIHELIDQFNLQSRIKINGMKTYEKQHCHERFFQREIPLSYEEEQNFYLETSARKIKGEYTKRVVSPSSTDKENRSNNVTSGMAFYNKATDSMCNNKDKNVKLQSLKESEQVLQECPRKELRTFESSNSSDANEFIIDNCNNRSKKIDSPSHKSADKDERLKQFFSFQKNESTAVKKQLQYNPSLQQPSIGFMGSQLQQSQIHTLQLDGSENAADYSSRIQTNNILKQGEHRGYQSKRDNNNNNNAKSQSQRSTGRNMHSNRTDNSRNSKKQLDNTTSDVITKDAATSIQHCISRDDACSTRNVNHQQSHQSSMYSPMLQAQGVVCDLSFPSMTSKECRSLQQNNSIAAYGDDQLAQASQYPGKNQHDWSVGSMNNSAQEQSQESQLSREQFPTKEEKQVLPRRTASSSNNRLTQQKEQQQLAKEINSNVSKAAVATPQKVLFYNPYLQERTNQQQIMQNPQEISKSARLLRSNSCYSTDRYEYQGCLQPKNKDLKPDSKENNIFTVTPERSQGNSIRNKQAIKRKVSSNERNHKNNYSHEEKLKNKQGKYSKKIIPRVEKQVKIKNTEKEVKNPDVVRAVIPADQQKKSEKTNNHQHNHADLARIRSKSLIEKIQHDAISRDYVTYLIQQHASCCRNFRKELQTSLCNNTNNNY